MKQKKHKPSCNRQLGDHLWCNCGALGTREEQQARIDKAHGRHPGAAWRFKVGEHSQQRRIEDGYDRKQLFDEIVVDDWLHVEALNARDFWVRLGNRTFNVHIAKSGVVTVEG